MLILKCNHKNIGRFKAIQILLYLSGKKYIQADIINHRNF